MSRLINGFDKNIPVYLALSLFKVKTFWKYLLFREISAMEKKHKHLIEMLAAIDPAIYLQVSTGTQR
jgi:hypothetical protein